MSFYSFGDDSGITAHEHYMRMALEEAKAAYARDEVPIGAIVVCKNRIVGRGSNMTEQLADVTAHAEMQAITAAAQHLGGKYLRDCTLYVTIEPCVMCAGALYWAQVDTLVYGAAEEKRGYHSRHVHALHPKTTVVRGVLEDECRELMQRFFSAKR